MTKEQKQAALDDLDVKLGMACAIVTRLELEAESNHNDVEAYRWRTIRWRVEDAKELLPPF